MTLFWIGCTIVALTTLAAWIADEVRHPRLSIDETERTRRRSRWRQGEGLWAGNKF